MIDLNRILLPTDFSKYSHAAMPYAAALAEKFGAEIHLLHVVEEISAAIPDMVNIVPPIAPPIQQIIDAAKVALDRQVKDECLSKVQAQPVVREGSPFYEIIQYAKEQTIDLIIMGTHGRAGLAHVLLGSVTEKIVRKAPCPVLTVRHPEHEFVHP